ncbi:MAG: hypothetical protein HYX59_01435 [Elusimicrobia bacterium]|nr:hypothetical protein [Elusimicrobiota bacterium]
MKASLRDNAPAFLLVLASAILAVAFGLPIGAERLARTQYQRLEGFVGSFDSAKAPDADVKGAPATGTETWGLVAQAVRQRYTPIEANALLSRVESLTKTKETTEKAAARSIRQTRKRAVPAAPAAVAASSAPITPQSPAPPPAATPAPETADSMGEIYENDPAKYSLDPSAAQGSIVFRLRGLSRSGGRYILKVSVTNRGADDFFVREFSLRDGQEVIGSKSFVRLFVEPGRTREGFVIFEKPRSSSLCSASTTSGATRASSPTGTTGSCCATSTSMSSSA